MNQLRSVGMFLVVCAAVCGVMAFERYNTARRTAMAIAETLDGVEFESVGIPMVAKIAVFLGVILLVAGLRCIYESTRKPSADKP